MTELAAQAAMLIQNAQLFKEVEEAGLRALVALANASDRRDKYTANHSQRVTEYTKAIARQMHYHPKPSRVSNAARSCTTSGRSAFRTRSFRSRTS